MTQKMNLKQEIWKEELNMESSKLQNDIDVVAFYLRKQNEEHVAYLKARQEVHQYYQI
jgi:hypothetical protein